MVKKGIYCTGHSTGNAKKKAPSPVIFNFLHDVTKTLYDELLQ